MVPPSVIQALSRVVLERMVSQGVPAAAKAGGNQLLKRGALFLGGLAASAAGDYAVRKGLDAAGRKIKEKRGEENS